MQQILFVSSVFASSSHTDFTINRLTELICGHEQLIVWALAVVKIYI